MGICMQRTLALKWCLMQFGVACSTAGTRTNNATTAELTRPNYTATWLATASYLSYTTLGKAVVHNAQATTCAACELRMQNH